MKRPLLIPAIVLIAGILIAYYLEINNVYLMIGAFFTLVMIFIMIVKRKVPLLPLFLLIGIFGAYILNHEVADIYKFTGDERHTVIGIVQDYNVSKSSKSFVVGIETMDGYSAEGRILLRFYNKDPLYSIGETIKLTGILEKPPKNTNPGFFDYRSYLLTQGVGYIANGDKSDIEVIGSLSKLGFLIRKEVRDYVIQSFDKGLDEKNASFMKGLLLGESNYLDESEYQLYREMGVAHLLAVSGLHIGIIALSLIRVLSILGIKRRYSVILSIVIITIYGYAIGFPPSTTRGILMFSLIYLSRIIHRPSDPLNILLASLCITLIIEPLWILSSGFQLSYTAAASLILLANRIKGMAYPLSGRIVDGVSAVAAVNIGILPLQAYWFGSIPIIAFLSNLIVIPLATVSLIVGIITLAASWLSPLLNILLNIQRTIVSVIASLPIGTIVLPIVSIAEALLYIFLLIAAFNWSVIESLNSQLKKVVLLFLFLVLFYGFIGEIMDKPDEIHFIDVGQGDSALIMNSYGNFLVDAGGSLTSSYDVGSRITLPYLQKQGIRNLDAVFISHRHEDHYLGLLPVLDSIKVKTLFVNYDPPQELFVKAREKGIPIVILDSSKAIKLGGNNSLRVIWPEKGSIPFLNENNNSMVLLLELRDKKVLFTGDIEAEVERIIADKHSLDIDIIKVAHHGSNTSSTSEFINLLSPEYSIISVGRNNYFGHPSQEVLQNLDSSGSKVFRTDTMGMVKVNLDNYGIEVVSYVDDQENKTITGLIQEHWNWILFICVYFIISIYAASEYSKGLVIVNDLE